jgi:hypothetical protein
MLISLACTTNSTVKMNDKIYNTSLVVTHEGHERFYEETLRESNVNMYHKGFLPILSVQSKNGRDPTNRHILPKGLVELAQVLTNDEQARNIVVNTIGHQNVIMFLTK